jgi:tetratricopeptide (TPR) repeat protein
MAATTLFLGGVTVAFVLVVLPQRFVLQGDLRASGVSFPTGFVPFGPPEVTLRSPSVPPTIIEPVRIAVESAGGERASQPASVGVDTTAPTPQAPPALPVVSDAAVSGAAGDSIGVPRDPTLLDSDTVQTTIALARIALSDNDIDRSILRYAEAAAEDPTNANLLLEWADVLQYRAEDFAGASRVLERRAELIEPTAAERFRMAQLYVWTGDEESAEAHLVAALALDPETPGAWALLGDLHRWETRRADAADAYRRALELDPDEPVALVGRDLLRLDTERAVSAVDSPRVGPTITFFDDSDGFERLEVTAYGSYLPFPEVVELKVGLRRLEGLNAVGQLAVDEGGLFEGTVARWWNEGEFRAAVTVGAETSDIGGTEAIFGARLDARDLHGWNLEGTFRSAPAHRLTQTLTSAAVGVRAHQIGLGFYKALPAGFELSGALEGANLRGGGADVWRTGGGAALSSNLSSWFRSGISSRVVRYSAAAPSNAQRPLFWDPELFWSTGALFELHTRASSATEGLSAYLRATPGLALADERRTAGPEWVPQFEAQAGLRIQRAWLSLVVDGLYTRGRGGGYTSKGLTLGLEVRH